MDEPRGVTHGRGARVANSPGLSADGRSGIGGSVGSTCIHPVVVVTVWVIVVVVNAAITVNNGLDGVFDFLRVVRVGSKPAN